MALLHMELREWGNAHTVGTSPNPKRIDVAVDDDGDDDEHDDDDDDDNEQKGGQ